MGDKTKIQWSDATWNPVIGCSRVSAGCEHCYAERVAHRGMAPQHRGLTVMGKKGPRWNGQVRFVPSVLDKPLRWKRPRRIFVNSLSDLFHEGVTNEQIAAVFGVMAASPQHTFQVLTKRPARMAEWFRWAGDGSVIEQMREVALAGRIAEVFAEERIEPVRGWPGYFVTSHGRVLSDRKGPRREMKPMASEAGHERVMLYRGDGERSRPLIHRLVLEHFDRPPKDGEQACHIDGHPSNNRLWNLRWGSQSDNWQDRKRHGNHRSYQKLTQVDVDIIRQRLRDGETAEAIGRSVDVSATQVRNIASGAQWAEPWETEWPLKSVWLGVSVEDQATADERIPLLLEVPAAIRWVSYEPALGPVDFARFMWPVHDRWTGPYRSGAEARAAGAKVTRHRQALVWSGARFVDWIVVGGESGPGARPCALEWIERTIHQCREAQVPVFVKQLGAVVVSEQRVDLDGRWAWRAGLEHSKGGEPDEWPEHLVVREMPDHD